MLSPLADLPPLLFLDFETTQSATGLRSVEVGWLPVVGGVVGAQQSRLVSPGCPIDRWSEAVHGISDADVAGAPRFDAVFGELAPLLCGSVVVAHNAHFDAGVMRNELSRFCLARPDLEWWCTLRLARRVWPRRFPSYSLGSLCRSLGLGTLPNHRAGEDAAAAYAVFAKALETLAPFSPLALPRALRQHAHVHVRWGPGPT
jgi:DNA polymerase-3 subunit epsilon